MRRILFVLSLTYPLVAFSQLYQHYTFDFSDPTSLNAIPALGETEDYNGAFVSLHATTLINDDQTISITFDGRTDDGQSGRLMTGWQQDDGSYDHFLFVSRGGGFTFNAHGVDIDTIIFENNSKVGNLKLISPLDIGRVDPVRQCWYGLGAKGVQSVSYQSQGQTPEIRAITVYYSSPLDVLEPIHVTPANLAEITSFRQLVLEFNKEISLGNEAKVVLRGPDSFEPIELNITLRDDYTIIAAIPDDLQAVSEISDDYQVIVSEKTAITKGEIGYYNKTTIYRFKIVEAHDTFNAIQFAPQQGEVSEIPSSIIIEFPSKANYSTSHLELRNTRTNEVLRELTASKLTQEEYEASSCYDPEKDITHFVKLSFIEGDIPVKASGIYLITVPEGFFGNRYYIPETKNYRDEGVLYNTRFTIEYNVNGVEYPSDSLLLAAKDLLSITGAGYPAVDSEARIALQALVDEGIGGKTVFEDAMAAFYAETNIEQPSNGFYLLSVVDPENNQVYVGYDKGKVVLTRDEEDAAHLLATVNDDGTIYFKTPDGKYLTQLAPDQNNVSDSYEAKKNDFTFSKLEVDGKTPKELFGLWTIHSWLRTTDEGVDKFANALVNLQTNAFETSDERERRYFDTTRSNAFRLTETDAPVPDVTYTLSPSADTEMESLYSITLTFGSDAKDVKLVDKSGIVLKGASTRQYVPTKIVNNGQQFIFYFDDVAAGTYTLTIPKGAFTYSYNEKAIMVKAISATYRVNSSAAFAEDFLYLHSTYYHNYPKIDTFVRDIDLNTFSMVIYDQGTYGLDSNKAITITDVAGSKEYGRGHFVFDNDFVNEASSSVTHIVLVMDNPIEYGTLPADTYCYNIPAGTFGDANFAAWLTDPQNKKKGDCHVNAYLTPMISVDNDRGNMIVEPQPITSVISKLSDITITFPYFENVSIQATNDIEVLERYTGRTITTSMVLVEGTTNKFRFASDEILTADTSNGGYMIVIPQNFFKAGTESFPGIRDMELFFYAKGDGDAIESVEAAQQQGVIFDLAGRRVKEMNKAGIYIVGGRKVVVK